MSIGVPVNWQRYGVHYADKRPPLTKRRNKEARDAFTEITYVHGTRLSFI